MGVSRTIGIPLLISSHLLLTNTINAVDHLTLWILFGQGLLYCIIVNDQYGQMWSTYDYSQLLGMLIAFVRLKSSVVVFINSQTLHARAPPLLTDAASPVVQCW